MPNIPGDIRSYRRDEITRTLSFPKTVSIGIIGIAEPYESEISLELNFPIIKEIDKDSNDYTRFLGLINGDYSYVSNLLTTNLFNGLGGYISMLDVIEGDSKVTFVVNLANLTYQRNIENVWLENGTFSQNLYNKFPFLEKYYPIDLVLLALYLINYEAELDNGKKISFSDLKSIKSVKVPRIKYNVKRYLKQNFPTPSIATVSLSAGTHFSIGSLYLRSTNISSNGFDAYSFSVVGSFDMVWKDYQNGGKNIKDFTRGSNGVLSSLELTLTSIKLNEATKDNSCFNEQYSITGSIRFNLPI